mgnify:CR=1 FL=1
MKKKQFALGSLLLGAASWLCLWGLQHIERRMKKKQKVKSNDPRPAEGSARGSFCTLHQRCFFWSSK